MPDAASGLLADLGNTEVAVPVLGVVLLWSAWRGRAAGLVRWWPAPLLAAAALALVPALVVPLKELFARTGPPGMLGKGYYPSGHAATAAVAYGAAALLIPPWVAGSSVRRQLAAAVLVLNAGVGLGLVCHGYHWPVDVLASWCLAPLLLWPVAAAVAHCDRGGRPGRQPK
ncbi:phosphatase PAP2 family protein [Streptomyces sp. NPDC058045]|uniref:phosphatase PAP2 family protein n=1 Tax=Streptomyces sp. NPDC058045 TaxID=3346311 RepID=UPI0036EDBD1F